MPEHNEMKMPINKILKLVRYEIECLKHQPQLRNDLMENIDYEACEMCPLNDKPYCELGKLRIMLRNYFDEHPDELEKLPLQIELLIYPERVDKLLSYKELNQTGDADA